MSLVAGTRPAVRSPMSNIDTLVTRGMPPADGRTNIPSDSQLYAQIDVLNREFGPSGFQFQMAGAQTVVNGSWWVPLLSLYMQL